MAPKHSPQTRLSLAQLSVTTEPNTVLPHTGFTKVKRSLLYQLLVSQLLQKKANPDHFLWQMRRCTSHNTCELSSCARGHMTHRVERISHLTFSESVLFMESKDSSDRSTGETYIREAQAISDGH